MRPYDAVRNCFANFINVNGRARRSEYWFFVLFVFVVSLIVSMISLAIDWSMLTRLWQIFILLPSVAVSVRRLHDIGKPGIYYLVVLIPIVGGFIMLYWALKDSQPGHNQYGPNPKEPFFF